MIVCDWGGTFPTWKCWILCTIWIHVPCNSKQEQDKGYTEKYLFFVCFLSILHIWATYQIFCSTNHLQQKHQNVLFTFYKNWKWLSRRQIWQISWPVNFFLENDNLWLLSYYLWLDKLTRRSGIILDESHLDTSGRKPSWENPRSEMKVYFTWRNRTPAEYVVWYLFEWQIT